MTVLRVAARRLVAINIQAVGADLLHLRVAPGLGDTQLRAGLHHPQAGNLQIRVVGVRLGNQAIEHRVGEYLPPLAQVRVLCALAGPLDRRAAPMLHPRLGRRLKVRSHLHATAEAKCADQQ
ncbi:hypothetical protein D3C84_417820 [compost metagenome]